MHTSLQHTPHFVCKKFFEDVTHESLKGDKCIGQSKWHHSIGISALSIENDILHWYFGSTDNSLYLENPSKKLHASVLATL